MVFAFNEYMEGGGANDWRCAAPTVEEATRLADDLVRYVKTDETYSNGKPIYWRWDVAQVFDSIGMAVVYETTYRDTGERERVD